MTYLQAFIIAIIEGVTEFLPVSSTGHMILADSLMKIQNREFAKTFEIVIQLGAILAVLFLYIRRFFVSINIYLKLFVAFIPTGIIGLLAYKTIKLYLFNPVTVSFSLILGGVLLILLDRWSDRAKSKYVNVEDIGYADAVKIGFIQCLSMIPGVSRAAATIFGGVFAGFNRAQAAEFSFLLAIPTMFAASGYDLLKEKDNISGNDWQIMLFGAVVAFVVAVFAVKGFIAFLNRYGFRHFGYYRIFIGVLFLTLYLVGGVDAELN
jgi:undecaprenyl-diphosphatase